MFEFLHIDFLREREEEEDEEEERETSIVDPLIYASLVDCYVPWLGIEAATLAYLDDLPGQG